MLINLDTSTSVRIHKSIALLHPAANLWYLCRAADPEGRGRVELSASEWQLLGVSRPTIYRWLREGWALGLFRNYWWEGGDRLTVSLAGLKKACLRSGMESWGPTATVSLGDILGGRRRAIASAIQTQDLQERSRYAARHALNKLERKHFKIPSVAELNLSSPKMDCGEVPGLVHAGSEKIFVGRSFLPFGVSQERICEELNAEARSCGVTTRTLRNHLKRLSVDRRQVVQAKPEYREIGAALRWDAQGHRAKGDADIWFEREGDHIRLREPNGKSSARREGGHRLKPDRLFRYFGADWIYRCNLYGLAYELTSMKRSRAEYKRRLTRNDRNPYPEPISGQSDAGDATTQLTEGKLNTNRGQP